MRNGHGKVAISLPDPVVTEQLDAVYAVTQEPLDPAFDAAQRDAIAFNESRIAKVIGAVLTSWSRWTVRS